MFCFSLFNIFVHGNIIYNMYVYIVHACRQYQVVLIVCRSRLIYGLYDFVRINNVVYTKWGIFTYLTSLFVNQYHVHGCIWCQTVLIVCRKRVIYGFNVFACLDKLLYTNIYNLGHFWAQKYLFSVPICQPVLCKCT